MYRGVTCVQSINLRKYVNVYFSYQISQLDLYTATATGYINSVCINSYDIKLDGEPSLLLALHTIRESLEPVAANLQTTVPHWTTTYHVGKKWQWHMSLSACSTMAVYNCTVP